jgi:Arc/MetJ family transcription regulator
MRTTVNIDDDLLSDAERLTGVSERTALINAGLRALIERESARRLARLGGTEPQLKPVPRRRSKAS